MAFLALQWPFSIPSSAIFLTLYKANFHVKNRKFFQTFYTKKLKKILTLIEASFLVVSEAEGGWIKTFSNYTLLSHQFSSYNNNQHTANVLPMETTDFVCVKNPVLVYLYFLKEFTADFILKNLEYLELYFLKTTDCVYKN